MTPRRSPVRGVDFLKYDYCHAPDDLLEAIHRYTTMGNALKGVGRPILFSICEWGPRSPWLWGRQVGGHMWRISYDVGDQWDSPHNVYSCIGILAAIDASANHEKHAGPGGWNDPDMLVVGLGNKGNIKGGGCTTVEYQTQMSMWCLLAAPLMIGCDIRAMDAATKRILDQPRSHCRGSGQAWQAGPSHRAHGLDRCLEEAACRRRACHGAAQPRRKCRRDHPRSGKTSSLNPARNYAIRDLWTHQDLGVFKDSFAAQSGFPCHAPPAPDAGEYDQFPYLDDTDKSRTRRRVRLVRLWRGTWLLQNP